MKDSNEWERFLDSDNEAETALSVAVSVAVVEAEDAATAMTGAAADKTSQLDMLEWRNAG